MSVQMRRSFIYLGVILKLATAFFKPYDVYQNVLYEDYWVDFKWTEDMFIDDKVHEKFVSDWKKQSVSII